MPMLRKPTPEKYCASCGARLERKRLKDGRLESLLHFTRRKFCNKACCNSFSGRPHKPDAKWMTAHYHARRMVPRGPCAICGKPNATDVHHRDGNFRNNAPENLIRLCRSCHIKTHRKPKVCKICGAPMKGLGYCEKHYQRFKKYGDPLLWKRNQHTPLISRIS